MTEAELGPRSDIGKVVVAVFLFSVIFCGLRILGYRG